MGWSRRFVISLVAGAILTGLSFLAVRGAYSVAPAPISIPVSTGGQFGSVPPASPLSCPQLISPYGNNGWNQYVGMFKLGSGDCGYGNTWFAGWPVPLNSETSGPQNSTLLAGFIPIIDFIFWSLISFAILSIFNKSKPKQTN